MNNKIKASLVVVLLALGGVGIFSAFRPVHVPAPQEADVIQMPEMVITPTISVQDLGGEVKMVQSPRTTHHKISAKNDAPVRIRTIELEQQSRPGARTVRMWDSNPI